jgi:hypothetical protein
MSDFDHRRHPRVAEILQRMPAMEHPPHVGPSDLEEVELVVRALPPLRFPINSAGELLDQLRGHEIMVVEHRVDAARMIKYLPPHYFPLASMENFVEKMATLVRENRKAVDVPQEIANIHRQLPPLRYPIRSADELTEQVGADRTYRFQGGRVRIGDIKHRLPAEMFPINSDEDFDAKIGQLMRNRPLIVKD